MLICPQCKKELPLKKGFSRVWECQDCQVTFIMVYGLESMKDEKELKLRF